MILKENSHAFWDMKQQVLFKVSEKESQELLSEMLSFLVTLLNAMKKGAFTVNMKNQIYAQKSDLHKVLVLCLMEQLVSEQKMGNRFSILWVVQLFLNTQLLPKFLQLKLTKTQI